jgi:hypothetical protein
MDNAYLRMRTMNGKTIMVINGNNMRGGTGK